VSDELALAAIVLLIAAMPASLAFLILADVVKLEGSGRKRRWIRIALLLAAIPLSVPLFYSLWGAAGAAISSLSAKRTRHPSFVERRQRRANGCS